MSPFLPFLKFLHVGEEVSVLRMSGIVVLKRSSIWLDSGCCVDKLDRQIRREGHNIFEEWVHAGRVLRRRVVLQNFQQVLKGVDGTEVLVGNALTEGGLIITQNLENNKSSSSSNNTKCKEGVWHACYTNVDVN